MNDLQILTFGCAVTFLAVGGAYIAIREQYLSGIAEKLAARRQRLSEQEVPSAQTAEQAAR